MTLEHGHNARFWYHLLRRFVRFHITRGNWHSADELRASGISDEEITEIDALTKELP